MRFLKMLSCLFILALTITGVFAWQHNERDYTLSEAVSHNDIVRVQKLLEAGADPNVQWSGYRWQERLTILRGRDPWSDGPLDKRYNVVNYTNDPKIKALLLAHGATP